MDGKAFKSGMVHSVVLTITALNNLVPLLKSFINSALK